MPIWKAAIKAIKTKLKALHVGIFASRRRGLTVGAVVSRILNGGPAVATMYLGCVCLNHFVVVYYDNVYMQR